MPNELCSLQEGYVFKNRWLISRKLGAGGFGAVYIAKDRRMNEVETALKVEFLNSKAPVLKMETFVLHKLQGRSHTLKFFDAGSQDKYRFLVMQLAGSNLADLKRDSPDSRFTCSTTVRLGIQSVEAIRDIHQIGFVHRDIKPSNFAMGKDQSDCRKVYLLDFGLARQYVSKRGSELRPPRAKCGFRGTIRYASPNTHMGKEQGRHDDLFCMLYMLIEFIRGTLPWQKNNNKDEVGKLKANVDKADLLKESPPQFGEIMENLTKLSYADTPDYNWIIAKFRQVMTTKGYKDTAPFDWEDGAINYQHTQLAKPKSKTMVNPYESQMAQQKDVVRGEKSDSQ